MSAFLVPTLRATKQAVARATNLNDRWTACPYPLQLHSEPHWLPHVSCADS
jgi:hypothetical protein